MARPIIKIIDGDVETLREMTVKEFAEYEATIADSAALTANREAKELAKQAVLAKLGLTAEELAALL